MKIETPRQPQNSRWWELLLFAFILFGIAYYFFIDLTTFEERGGERKIIWFLACLYDAFGKFGVVIPIAAIGSGFFFAGIFKLLNPTRTETKF